MRLGVDLVLCRHIARCWKNQQLRDVDVFAELVIFETRIDAIALSFDTFRIAGLLNLNERQWQTVDKNRDIRTETVLIFTSTSQFGNDMIVLFLGFTKSISFLSVLT
jgi:hypothetical protein